MDIQTLDCDKILFPGRDDTTPSFRKQVAECIALSIKADRLYHPITVRADPEHPELFQGIQGRHRLHAQYHILKRPTIDCVVLVMDDKEAEIAALAENTFRKAMRRVERARAVRAWHRLFEAKYPERVGRGKKGLAAMQHRNTKEARNRKTSETHDQTANLTDGNSGDTERAQNHDQTANLTDGNSGDTERAENHDQTANLTDGNSGDTERAQNDDQTAQEDVKNDADGTEEAAHSEPTFAQLLAAVTNVSESTAKREQRIALNLTDEQLQICDRQDLTSCQIGSIAALKDKDQRAALIDLIRSRTPFDEAWERIAPNTKKSTSKSRAREAAEARAVKERQSDLSDDEWVTAHCASTVDKLADSTRFKADALLFRRIVTPCRLFRAAVEGALVQTASPAHADPFHDLVLRCARVAHPRDWPLCGTCQGQGCPTCRGAGYYVGNSLPWSSTVAMENDDTETVSRPDAPAPVPSMPVASAEVGLITPIDPPAGSNVG